MIKSYVWYVGYGSNLSEQRFLCYIKGGIPHYGNRKNEGCSDKNPPIENKRIEIHYELYFALPDKLEITQNWGPGGVAFVNPDEGEKSKTFCRMWKITKEQYEEVRTQEGRAWYDKEIKIGEEGGVPIYTMTSKKIQTNLLSPSDAYIKTIALGLRETYKLDNEGIAHYLIDKKGIKANLREGELLRILASLQ